LDTNSSEKTILSEQEFRDNLVAHVPQLRAFARFLIGNTELVDDLVQETMLKAWRARDRFEAGSNFKAWSFTILRHHFYSASRRDRFHGDWDDRVADRVLAAPATQDMHVQLNDVFRALQQLSVPLREALVLVGAAGLSYEEVAEMCDVAIGTIKSRVWRARAALKEICDGGVILLHRGDAGKSSDPAVRLMDYAANIQAGVMAGRANRRAALAKRPAAQRRPAQSAQAPEATWRPSCA
jgi:RNA polymerase sigma factor (sigma-70 family)